MKMVNVNELSPPSNTLKASDFEGGEWELTIESYVIREFDQQDQKTGETYKQKKPIFSFFETEKTWVCNKTCRNDIAYVYGDEMDDWIGKKIFLFGKKVEFGNKMVDGIRVRVERPVTKPSSPKKSKPYDERNPPPSDEIGF
jgi:hypothetical protein